jgi:hypothetical protein
VAGSPLEASQGVARGRRALTFIGGVLRAAKEDCAGDVLNLFTLIAKLFIGRSGIILKLGGSMLIMLKAFGTAQERYILPMWHLKCSRSALPASRTFVWVNISFWIRRGISEY